MHWDEGGVKLDDGEWLKTKRWLIAMAIMFAMAFILLAAIGSILFALLYYVLGIAAIKAVLASLSLSVLPAAKYSLKSRDQILAWFEQR